MARWRTAAWRPVGLRFHHPPEVEATFRDRLSTLPAQVAIGQPISHRLDHLLSGVRAQIAVKIFGDDTDTLRGLAEQMRSQLATVPGLVDLTVEKQVLIPQVKIRIDYERAAQLGVAPGPLLKSLEHMIDGVTITRQTDELTGLSSIVVLDVNERPSAGKEMRPTVKLVDLNGKDVMIPGTDVAAQYFLPGKAIEPLSFT